jgi:hypothetical protein
LILSLQQQQQQQTVTTPTQHMLQQQQQQQQTQTKERKRKRKTDTSSTSVCASPSQHHINNDNLTPNNKAYKWDATTSGSETKTNHVKKNIQDFFGKVCLVVFFPSQHSS